jgi:hypothetical protein
VDHLEEPPWPQDAWTNQQNFCPERCLASSTVVADPKHVGKALDALVAVYQYLISSPNGAIARYQMEDSDVDIALDEVAKRWTSAR